MKCTEPEGSGRYEFSNSGWAEVPTAQTPDGWVRPQVNWANGCVALVCDTNEEIARFAADLTPQRARQLGDALVRLSVIAERANPE